MFCDARNIRQLRGMLRARRDFWFSGCSPDVHGYDGTRRRAPSPAFGPQAAQCARWRRAGALAAADHAHTATRGQPAPAIRNTASSCRPRRHASRPAPFELLGVDLGTRSQYETTTSRLYRVGSGTRKFSQEWHQVNELTSLRWYVSRDVIGMR